MTRDTLRVMAQEHIAFICRETPEEIMKMLMAEETKDEDTEV